MAITMEELKQKAQRYDEALEKAKRLYEKGTITESLCHIFPELKESGDEEIRKELMDFVVDNTICQDGRREKWIAWLEKQKQDDLTNYKKILSNYDEAEKEKCDFVGDGFIKCYADFQDFKEGETYWFEYIGDDKYNVRSDNLLGKTYHITPCQLYTIFKKQTWLEKQGESKIDDNTEPKDYNSIDHKFHEGDWIISNNNKYIYQVVEVKRGIYVIRDNADNREYCVGIESADRDGRLWNISDAKTGDVLAFDNIIVMFKDIYTKCTFRSYCYIEYETFCICKDNTSNLWVGKGFHPATKEQCDQFEKAMTDAGWEFDFEKKELKKLGQQCEVPVTINIDKMVMDYTNECGNDGFGNPLNCMIRAYRQGLTDAICTLILANKKTTDKVEQEPTKWTEEDEEMLDFCCNYLDTLQTAWLQSLKQRIGG